MRRRLLRRPIIVLICTGALLVGMSWSSDSAADSYVSKVARNLVEGPSFQIRVQAALALGSSDSEAAVQPLCGALKDEAASVRAAAAAALGRLRKPSGLECINKRTGTESNNAVKRQLRRASNLIAARASRTPTQKSRFYVAIDPAKCKADRRKRDVELLVQATIRSKLMAAHNVGVAPFDQNKSTFAQITRRNRIQGYLLRPTVESIDYDGSKLSVAVRVISFSYPTMALQAEYAPKMSTKGPPSLFKELEDQLVQMATEKAIQRFLETTR